MWKLYKSLYWKDMPRESSTSFEWFFEFKIFTKSDIFTPLLYFYRVHAFPVLQFFFFCWGCFLRIFEQFFSYHINKYNLRRLHKTVSFCQNTGKLLTVCSAFCVVNYLKTTSKNVKVLGDGRLTCRQHFAVENYKSYIDARIENESIAAIFLIPPDGENIFVSNISVL